MLKMKYKTFRTLAWVGLICGLILFGAFLSDNGSWSSAFFPLAFGVYGLSIDEKKYKQMQKGKK